MLGNERSWPELAEEFGNDGSGLPVDGPAWHARVSPLIEALWSPHPLARSRAMLRLFVPYRRGALTHEQIVLQLPELEPGLG